MSLEGRIEWTGDDPHVCRLTDNGTRRVQIVLATSPWENLEIRATVGDVLTLVRALNEAATWAAEGG